ncbi:hypothetical protein [Capnocytophaga bilenii]
MIFDFWILKFELEGCEPHGLFTHPSSHTRLCQLADFPSLNLRSSFAEPSLNLR